jgi:mRNA interferase MazF
MKWGEVRWYTFKEPDKRRPVLILTRNSAINLLNALTVAPITTIIRDIPSEVFLSREDGLFTDCAVNLDNVQTVPKINIGELITRLSPERMDEVKRALVFALGFDSLLFR